MISCIICSRQSNISEELKKNIAFTIGCQYELVVIDNSMNDYSIFSAYNEGVRRAKGDILCFMHEDIFYHTREWGNIVTQVLKNKNIGIIGAIGSQFLPNRMASWWLCGATKGQVLQGTTNDNDTYSYSIIGEEIQQVTDVVVVDGLWFCMGKDMFKSVIFDEETYNSYHCYDVDMCMQVCEQEKRVVVLPNILIEHYSMGNVKTTYYSQLQTFYKKWQHRLPIWRGRSIKLEDALWVSEILDICQKSVCRNVFLENSKAYRFGRLLISPFKYFKRWKKKI